MSWKQPIPTGLEAIFGEDFACMALYKELIYRAANKDGYFTTKRGHTLPILRGQTVFGRRQFHAYLAWEAKDDGKKVQRCLTKLCEKYQKVTLQMTQKECTIVSLLGYDDLVSLDPTFDPTVTHQRPTNDPPMTLSKSVKKEKSVKQEPNSNELGPPASGYTKWEDEFERSLGFRITQKPKENENALKACVDKSGVATMHNVLGYLAWLKQERTGRQRPHWFQYVTSFIKIRSFWDNIQAGMTDDAYHHASRTQAEASFFNR